MVFVRFTEGVTADERAEEIRRAGYEISERIDYAPNAAWLRADSRSIVDALKRIKALEQMPGIENVEPQMLMASARKE